MTIDPLLKPVPLSSLRPTQMTVGRREAIFAAPGLP